MRNFGAFDGVEQMKSLTESIENQDLIKEEYTPEEQKDEYIMHDIGRQALCFCSKNILKIWKIMGWKINRRIRYNILYLSQHIKWCPDPEEIAQIVCRNLIL